MGPVGFEPFSSMEPSRYESSLIFRLISKKTNREIIRYNTYVPISSS